MDAAVRARLDQLRRHGRRGYAEHAPVEGSSLDGAVTLVVDASGWVDEVRVGDVTGLREPAALASAVNEAYQVATLRRTLEASAHDPATPEEKEAALALVEGRGAVRVRPAPRVPLPSPPALSPEDLAGPGIGDRRPAPLRGTSRDRELDVVAHFPAGFSSLEADAAWLSSASADDVRYALKEAFASAYTRGEW